MERATAARDAAQLSDLVTSVHALVNILNQSHDSMQSFARLARNSRAVNVITETIIEVSSRGQISEKCRGGDCLLTPRNTGLWPLVAVLYHDFHFPS